MTPLTRRILLDARARTLGFTYAFAVIALLQPIGYRHAYPTLASRIVFAHDFGANQAVVLFYGKAYDLLTVGGYSAWRVGGVLAIVAAAFGVMASVRALRADEELGRSETILATSVARRSYLRAALSAVLLQALALWAAETVGCLVGGLPVGGSAYLALCGATMTLTFAAFGALISQLAATRRLALELGLSVVTVALVLRVVADTGSGVGWLRWLTPLGWAEAARPFTGAQPLVLLIPVAVSVGLVALTLRLAVARDIGTGVISARDARSPRLWLLSSPTAQALRSQWSMLATWTVAVGAFALIVGYLSKAATAKGAISKQLEQLFHKLGVGSLATASGYLGFAFLFFVVALAFFAAAQMAAAQREEDEGRLQTVLALRVSRERWLGGRLLLALAGAVVLSLVAAGCAMVGAAAVGVDVSLRGICEAALNCAATAVLFLGLSTLAFTVWPRAGVGIAYGLVLAAFLWEISGSLLGAPSWLVDLTPFAHLGLAPAAPFRLTSVVIIAAIGVATAGAGAVAFRRSDLI